MLQLFTDTSANLPVALTKQHHITVVPFSYTVDGKETDYPDDVDFDGAAFYGAMRRGAVVKTSMVNPDLMANYFERALSQLSLIHILSADVTAAYDPNFADVYDKRNSAFVNYGVALCKYTCLLYTSRMAGAVSLDVQGYGRRHLA